jgi:hypothetical protein
MPRRTRIPIDSLPLHMVQRGHSRTMHGWGLVRIRWFQDLGNRPGEGLKGGG